MIVAIQPDNYGPHDSSSPVWTRLLCEAGHEVREVNVYRADILDQLNGCQGFMWRYNHNHTMRQIARRLLPVLERCLGLVVYPDQNTCWHYDDKIAQAHLLSATGIPTPKTWIWFDREAALNWAVDAPYPLVIKLWAGAGGTNVRLISSFEKARLWIDKLFYNGVASLADEKITLQRRLVEARNLLLRGERSIVREWHRDYVLFQEFLSGNAFDTRVTVIGKRAFGFRRFNREGDFRASGSGIIDWNPAEVAADFIRLAFEVADRLKTQSCAIDGLWRDGEAMVAEISYTYASWAVERCPGYWDPEMNWHEGILSPEEAQVQDFLLRLSSVQNNSV